MARYILDVGTTHVDQKEALKQAQGYIQNIMDAVSNHGVLAEQFLEVHLVEETNAGQFHEDQSITESVVNVTKELSNYAEEEANAKPISFLDRYMNSLGSK